MTNEIENRTCPLCGEGHYKGKKWVFAPNRFLPDVDDGTAVCQKHYKQAYSSWRYQTKLKNNETFLALRRKKYNKRYKEDSEYRTRILEKTKRQREKNGDKIKEKKRIYDKTEQGKKAHRNRCKRHYNKNQEKQKQRMKQLALNPKRQYTYIKRRANAANLEFQLQYEDYLELRSPGVCFYCKTELSLTAPNIDRLDSSKGYIKENCVPCCLKCNLIKRNLLKPEELVMYHKVLAKEIEPPLDMKYSLYTPKKISSTKKRWGRLLAYARRKQIPLELTFEQYQNIISIPCVYCSAINLSTGYGIDRIKPSLGYTYENSVSCCPPCNQIKGNILASDQMKLLNSIIHFYRKKTLPQ